MPLVKPLSEWLLERSIELSQLIEASSLDKRIVEAIAHGRYTPSPEQRRRIAAALSVEADQIAWGHYAQVEHMHGHGPQFGRSP